MAGQKNMLVVVQPVTRTFPRWRLKIVGAVRRKFGSSVQAEAVLKPWYTTVGQYYDDPNRSSLILFTSTTYAQILSH